VVACPPREKEEGEGCGRGGLSVFPREHSATQLIIYTRANAHTHTKRKTKAPASVYTETPIVVYSTHPHPEQGTFARCALLVLHPTQRARAHTLHKECASARRRRQWWRRGGWRLRGRVRGDPADRRRPVGMNSIEIL
jgi:hypothetical protein